jgi:iron complex transport system ATP-binding protein
MLKDGKVFAAGDKTVITPRNIEAVYGLPVDVENYRGRLVVVPQ